MTKTYRASCHCAAVKVEAELDLSEAPTAATAPSAGARAFGRNHHYFCRHCGVRVSGVGSETPIGLMYGVNIGCLADVSEEELSKLPITYVDGRNDRWPHAPEFLSHL